MYIKKKSKKGKKAKAWKAVPCHDISMGQAGRPLTKGENALVITAKRRKTNTHKITPTCGVSFNSIIIQTWLMHRHHHTLPSRRRRRACALSFPSLLFWRHSVGQTALALARVTAQPEFLCRRPHSFDNALRRISRRRPIGPCSIHKKAGGKIIPLG